MAENRIVDLEENLVKTLPIPLFTDGETEAPRREVVCQIAHSQVTVYI